MISELSYGLALGVMIVVVLGTRIAGAVFMSWFTPSPGIERFLEGLAASVIAALVASFLVTNDVKLTAAVVCAILTMLATRNVVWAMLIGMLAAALHPHLVQL
ncbi:MAG: AzlD domain-containing protein [Pseudomonadota bacterium]